MERGTAAEGGRGSVGPPLQNLVIAIFEFAYLMCYPFVPLGLMALYMMGSGRFAPEFWNVVLPPAFICYGTFPFVQTLPPRAIEGAGPAASGKTAIRRTNLLVLRYLSVQANTFPSGHVAASLAVALVLVRHETLVGLFFLIVAIAIAAGAFAGRYHYALDVLIGAALAVISFVLNYIRMR